MVQEASYEQLLLELEQERENIDRMIVWVKGKMQQSGRAETVVVAGLKTGTDGRTRFPRIGMATDAFFRMSVPDAVKKFLNIVKGPRTAKDITAGLEQGGLTHQAKNLYATVYPTLLRMLEAGDVVRVSKNEWGLAEWYPAGRKAAQEEKTESES
jgi:hypothetical protein